jgi:zinc transporter, ZIP family
MPTGAILLLGAIAGLTIYLGLPLAFLKGISAQLRAFTSMLATGVLIFLLYDILKSASAPIEEALDQMRTQHSSAAPLVLDVLLLILGLGLGLVGLVYLIRFLRRRFVPIPPAPSGDGPPALSSQPVHVGVQERSSSEFLPREAASASRHAPAFAATPRGELVPQTLALIIALGIGLHNFSEGLAIGQAAAAGALQLAVLLIVGFGLHNMTEGFGIAGPLAGQAVSWRFVALAGLIAGGPTLLGTAIGVMFQSPQLFIFCLALAAGAIIYVVAELFGVAKRFQVPELLMWGVFAGFFLGYATDLLLDAAGG